MDSAKFGVADNFSDSLEDVLDQSQGQSAIGGGLNAADPLISQSNNAYTGLGIEANVSSGVNANTVGVTFDNSSESQSLGNDFTIGAPSANAPAGPPAAPGPAVSLQSLANYLTTGYWSSAEGRPSRYYNVDDTGSGANFGTLYYNVAGFASSLSTIYGTESADSNGISAARADMVREAFRIYGQVLGINFVETTSTLTHVDFFFSDNKSGAYAGSQMVSGNGGPIDYTVINVNSGWNGGTSTIGDYTFQTFLHEIGHALGLGHQGNYNGSGGFLGDAVYENDSWALSMMSYFDQVENSSSSTTNYDYARLISPMAVDWIALNDLYGGQDYVGHDFGINNAFTGNTTWGFNTNITVGQSAALADLANLADTNAFTIIDSGGIDTVDFSGFSADQTINLIPSTSGSTVGSVSSVGGLTGNMSIAVGTIIENAVGGSGADHIYGNDFSNTLTGNGGADVIKGLGGNDTIYGNAGIDSLYGDDGSDTITDSGDNTVYGGAGNDYIINTFVGGGTWDGGDDIDTIDLSSDNFSANINLNTASFTAFGATFSNFENATGTQGNDTITGSEDVNVLKGAGGNDTIVGNGGADTLSGGFGNDTITDSGNNSVFGDDGDDLIINTFVSGGTWDGGDGNDTIDLSGDSFTANINLAAASFTNFSATFSNFENAIGTQGNDTIIGSSISNMLNGSGGSDTMNGGGGLDNLFGGAGNDTMTYTSGEGYDNYDGGADVDTVILETFSSDTYQVNLALGVWGYNNNAQTFTMANVENVTTGNNNDTLIGNSANNILNGVGGNDTLNGGQGLDSLFGGAGNDTMTYTTNEGYDNYDGGADNDTVILETFFSDTYQVDLELGRWGYNNSGFGVGVGYDMTNVENITTGSNNDTITGNFSFNIINSGGGNDTVIDNDGSDDDLNGGIGIDTLNSDLTYVEDAVFNFATGLGLAFGNTVTFLHFTGFENITVGGGADVTGNGLNNIIIASDAVQSGINEINGGGGNDTISTGAGNDILNGGAGVDSMTGGANNDIYIVDVAADQVFEGIGGGVDRVKSVGTYTLAAGQEIETLETTNAAGVGAINLTGNEFNNKIYGNDGINRLDGSLGDDWLYGNGGNDQFFVDSAADRTYEAVSDGTDRVFASASYTLLAGQEIEILSTTNTAGVGAMNLKGNEFVNQIIGNNGNNFINGGLGNDTLIGGLGNDSFLFTTALGATNFDRINDFSIADDIIRLDDAVFALLTAGAVLAGNLFKNISLAAQDADDVILYNSANGNISYDSNGLTAGGVTLFADVTNGLLLSNADFFVI